MSPITHGGRLASILQHARETIKHYRPLLLIVSLINWVIGNITINSLNKVPLDNILSGIEKGILESGLDNLLQLYIEAFERMVPYLPTLLRVYTGAIVVGVIIVLIISYSTFEQDREGISTIGQKIGSACKQLIPVILTQLLMSIIVMIGFVLFIIPGIIGTIYRGFTLFVMAHDRIYFFKALQRSYQIVKHRWRETLGKGLVIILVLLFTFSAIGIAAALLYGLVSSDVPTDGFVSTAIIGLFTNIFGVLYTVMIASFFLRQHHTCIVLK